MKDSLLLALALGDGHISTNKNKTKACIVIRHSNHQIDYINWKYKLDVDLWSKRPTSYKNILNNKKYYGHYLRSHLDYKILDIYNILYIDGHKKYTKQALNLLDELGLAIWFMDKGHIDSPKDENPMGILNTYGRSPEGSEEKVVQQYFLEKWNIKSSINKNHGRYRIRFNYSEFCKLADIIRPYILDSMKYKIDTTMRLNDQAMPLNKAERYSLNFSES